MSDNNNDRREARRSRDCEVELVPDFTEAQAPERDAPKCDPVPVEIDEVLVTPSATPIVPPDLTELPDPIVLGNLETSASCAAEFTGGDPVTKTVESGTFTDSVHIQGLGISLDVVYRIGSLAYQPVVATALSLVRAANLSEAVQHLVQELEITQDDATLIVNALDSTQKAVQTSADLYAESSLDCYYVNPPMWVSCDPSLADSFYSLSEFTSSDEVKYPTTVVPEGTETSYESTEDAIDKVMRRFSCEYPNAAVTVYCSDLDSNFSALAAKDGTAYPVTNLPGVKKRTLVYSVVVPSATVFGATQEEADATAKSVGETMLDCFYPSAPRTFSCALDNAIVNANPVYADYLARPAGSALDKSSVPSVTGSGGIRFSNGISLDAPEGLTTSTSSQEDADGLAESYALPYISCYWENEEIACSCDEDAEAALSSSLPAGSFADYAGPVGLQAEDPGYDAGSQITYEQLVGFCENGLDCVYCNDEIAPTCAIAGYAGEEPIPEGVVDSNWSADATTGVAAGTVCLPDRDAAKAVAESLANISPAPTVATCTYLSDEVTMGCLDKFSGDSQKGLSILQSSEPITLVAGFVAVTDAQYTVVEGAGLSAEFVSWAAANSGGTQNAKSYANFLAHESVLSFLTCVFESQRTIVKCYRNNSNPAAALPDVGEATYAGNPVDMVGNAMGSRSLGDGKMTTSANVKLEVSEGSYGHDSRPVVIEHGSFTSYDSLDDANAQAMSLGQSLLDCFWSNPSMALHCGADVTHLATIESDRFSAGSIVGSSDVLSLGDGKIGTEAITGTLYNVASSVAPLDTASSVTSISAASVDISSNPTRAVIVAASTLVDPSSPQTGEINILRPDISGLTYRDPVSAEAYGSSSDPALVVAGSFRSYSSYAESVQMAATVAISSMDCYVPNTEGGASCASVAGDIFASSAVSSVTVSSGTFRSYSSQLEADIDAYTLAESTLNCAFTNNAQSSSCPSGTYAYKSAGSVAAGSVVSFVSTVKADEMALAMAQAARVCIAPADFSIDLFDITPPALPDNIAERCDTCQQYSVSVSKWPGRDYVGSDSFWVCPGIGWIKEGSPDYDSETCGATATGQLRFGVEKTDTPLEVSAAEWEGTGGWIYIVCADGGTLKNHGTFAGTIGAKDGEPELFLIQVAE